MRSRLAVYPEYGEAKRELARILSVAPDELLLTNGTDEAIQVLINTYVDDGEEVLVLRPSYAMYRFYAESRAATFARSITAPEHWSSRWRNCSTRSARNARRADRQSEQSHRHRLSTSTASSASSKRAPNAAVLIDEAYYEFCGVTALPADRRVSRISSSAARFRRCSAWRRCGWAACSRNAGNIEYLHKAQSPYSVNTLAALAARAAVQDTRYIADYVTEVLAARELLYVGLEKLGIPYVESYANFVLCVLGDRADRGPRRVCATRASWCATAATKSPAASASPSARASRCASSFLSWSRSGKAVSRVRYGRRAGGCHRILPRDHS